MAQYNNPYSAFPGARARTRADHDWPPSRPGRDPETHRIWTPAFAGDSGKGVARFEGYAARYNEPDLNGDIIEPGAFAKTLRNRTAPVRMLYQHASDTPIGRWTGFRETSAGLIATGELLLASQKARDIFALIAGGALDGLSIGYRTIRARKFNGAKGRRIVEADLWEVSIVTFPMAARARITHIESDGTEVPRKTPARPGVSPPEAHITHASSPEARLARAGACVIAGALPPSGRRAFSHPLLSARHFASAVRDAASILSVNGVYE